MSPSGKNADDVIAIDLGGTTVKAGVVNADGKILHQVKVPTKAEEGPLAVRRQILQSVDQLFHRYPRETIAAIGIGAPGMVSLDGERVQCPPNFSDWHDYRLKEEIQSAVGIPVEVENDANAAAIGEARFGAGRGHKNLIFVIWGTGVGGGIIVDDQIYRGAHGGAGEIGHTTIDYQGPQCNCGNKGCIEAFIGQRYLSDRTRERLEQHPNSKIVELVGGDLSRLEPVILSQAMDLGDKLAQEILVEAGSLLGIALASVMNILDIRFAIIGGGISATGDIVFEEVRKSIGERAMGPIRSSFQVVRAELGNDAGLLGAASFALSSVSGRRSQSKLADKRD
ncbi:MAG: ROK family protein [Bacteroidota bacterium]